MADFNIVENIKSYCDEMTKEGIKTDFNFDEFQKFLSQSQDFDKFLTGGVHDKQAPNPADISCKILVLDEYGSTTSMMDYLKYYYNPNINFDSMISYPNDDFINRFKLVNLKDYKVILIGELTSSWGAQILDALMNRKDDIDKWIKCGGSLISFADETGSSNSYAYLPLAVTAAQVGCLEDVQVTDPDSPIMLNLTGNLLSNWGCSYHVTFSNIPDYKVLSQNNAGAAITITAKFGSGNIILTGQDPDNHYYYSVGADLLTLNMLDFSCATCRGGCCCGEFAPQICCQVMLDHQTSLVPPAFIPAQGPAVLVDKDVHAKIEKVCAEKVIICGVLHKKLTYTAVNNCGNLIPNFKKFDDEKFQCFIDRKDSDAKEDDCFEITGASIMCDVCSGPDFFGLDPKKKQKVAWKFKEKDIIKVCVRKVVKKKYICKD